MAQKLIWHQHRRRGRSESLRPEVPEALAAIVERMMAKDPAEALPDASRSDGGAGSVGRDADPASADRELPQVSLAAGGGPARGSATQPVAPGRPNGNLESNAPTVVARAPAAQTHISGAVPQSDAVGSSQAVWESLDTDTQTVAQGDTDRPATASDPISRLYRATPRTADRRVVLSVIIGVLLLIGVATGAYFAGCNKTTRQPEPPPHVGPRTLIVSKAGGENTFPTLQEMLSKVKDGDTILIREPRVSVSAFQLPTFNDRPFKELTIRSETPDGKPAVIEASGGTKIMLEFTNIEGLRIQNVEFDGGRMLMWESS